MCVCLINYIFIYFIEKFLPQFVDNKSKICSFQSNRRLRLHSLGGILVDRLNRKPKVQYPLEEYHIVLQFNKTIL